MIDQRLKIAVFIDFDNIEIGVKTTLHTQFDIAAILDGIKERGEVVTKIAYGDWKRAGDYGRMMSQHAIRMVQRNLTPGGDKNGADINLALDALEMAFTHDHINAFVIVGGDSDFITLVEKLKQYDKKVFVVGGRQFTSLVMQKNCHEFIAYENLVSRKPSAPGPGPRRENGVAATAAPADVAKAIPLVKRALKVLTDREVSPQLGLLKSTLLQLDSTFSERDYGVSTFRDFIEKVAKTGLVTLRHSGRSMMVDAVDAADGAEISPASLPAAGFADTAPVEAAPSRPPAPAPIVPAAPAALDAEQVQQIVASVRDMFGRAAQTPRWPMYVRQLKQYLRTVDPNFDEHRWGFGTIMEFLRVVQREGLLRLERDRRGQIRVFPGSALPATASGVPTPASMEEQQPDDMLDVVEAEPEEEVSGNVALESTLEPAESSAPEPSQSEMIEIDEARQAAPRARRTRKAPTAGKPPARKSTGARTSSRRRKKPVPAA
ncbi:MAG: NYN domain-containing protein [Vicinamibacterales bacterium]